MLKRRADALHDSFANYRSDLADDRGSARPDAPARCGLDPAAHELEVVELSEADTCNMAVLVPRCKTDRPER